MSKLRVAGRMRAIQPFHVMDLLARARALEAQGRSIVHMEIGEPDFDTPAPIVAAGVRALQAGHTHYTPARGLPALRGAVSDFYNARYNVQVAPERILITPGASGALQLICGVLIDVGEKVLMADPTYPCNRHFVYLVEAQPVPIPVGPDTGYQLTAEHVVARWDDRTAAVLLASPGNPTGTLAAQDDVKAIIEHARGCGGQVIVDEIYHGLVYDDDAQTALAFSDDVFVINSFSKYFGMTGWRLGWVVVPEAYIREFDKLAQNIFLAAPTPSQYAALAAFESETLAILENRRREFRRRRDFLLPALRTLGFEIPVTPQGAFYVYADCSSMTDDTFVLARDLLEEAGVAVTPGIDFGSNMPERHMRFAYTTSLPNLQEGVRRIQRYLTGGAV